MKRLMVKRGNCKNGAMVKTCNGKMVFKKEKV